MKAEVIVESDQIEFTTKTNGDKVFMQGIHFGASDASKLAELINSQQQLKVVVKDIAEP
jgi:hypothetical protein